YTNEFMRISDGLSGTAAVPQSMVHAGTSFTFASSGGRKTRSKLLSQLQNKSLHKLPETLEMHLELHVSDCEEKKDAVRRIQPRQFERLMSMNSDERYAKLFQTTLFWIGKLWEFSSTQIRQFPRCVITSTDASTDEITNVYGKEKLKGWYGKPEQEMDRMQGIGTHQVVRENLLLENRDVKSRFSTVVHYLTKKLNKRRQCKLRWYGCLEKRSSSEGNSYSESQE
ncbi:unnamed protein product, partial [Cercopithifilaria johnstoni]